MRGTLAAVDGGRHLRLVWCRGLDPRARSTGGCISWGEPTRCTIWRLFLGILTLVSQRKPQA